MGWNNIEEIVDRLEENFHDMDLKDLSLVDLEEMIWSLNDFEEHETIVTKNLLRDILDAWHDLRGEI